MQFGVAVYIGINMIHCSKKNNIPTGAHYAILQFSSITIPGDERSRTHPGHGYPEQTIAQIEYVAYTDREEWRNEIEKRTLANDKDFIAIAVEPVKIRTVVTVEIGD